MSCTCTHPRVSLRHGFWRCPCGQRWASVRRWLRTQKKREDDTENLFAGRGDGDHAGGMQEGRGLVALAGSGPDLGDSDSRQVDFDAWLATGLDAGFCGPAVCETHDGTPTTAAEDIEIEDGWDPCIHVLRLYSDDITRKGVERNHAPSVWRKPR